MSIERCKGELNKLKEDLESFGLKAPDSLFELVVRERGPKVKKKSEKWKKKKQRISDELKGLVSEIEQLSMFDDENK